MGVLDEAIREHLELKRQHGASEGEIARAEAEALGPARRGGAKVLPADEALAPGYQPAREPDRDDHAETRLLQPLEPPDPAERQPAPDPELREDQPAPEPELREPRMNVVHDIDEDPLAPPPPVVEPPVEEAGGTDDDQLWPEREPPRRPHDEG